MPEIKPESAMLDEVRRWRKEAYEEWLRQTPAQRAEEERRLIETLGLRVVDAKDLATPAGPGNARRAG